MCSFPTQLHHIWRTRTKSGRVYAGHHAVSISLLKQKGSELRSCPHQVIQETETELKKKILSAEKETETWKANWSSPRTVRKQTPNIRVMEHVLFSVLTFNQCSTYKFIYLKGRWKSVQCENQLKI